MNEGSAQRKEEEKSSVLHVNPCTHSYSFDVSLCIWIMMPLFDLLFNNKWASIKRHGTWFLLKINATTTQPEIADEPPSPQGPLSGCSGTFDHTTWTSSADEAAHLSWKCRCSNLQFLWALLVHVGLNFWLDNLSELLVSNRNNFTSHTHKHTHTITWGWGGP